MVLGFVEKSISYIIGVYNGQDIIAEAVEECIAALQKDFMNFELIVVNDCSDDDTGSILDELALKHSSLKVIHNAINLNFGSSVLIGFNNANNDYVFYNAADLPLDPTRTKHLLEVMGDADVLVLERTGYNCTFYRKLVSNLNIVLLHIFFPFATKGTPILNFTQVFRRSIIHKIIPLARSPIFVWPELVFRAKYLGLNVKNVKEEVRIKTVTKGSFGKPHDIIWGLTDMLRFRLRVWQKKI